MKRVLVAVHVAVLVGNLAAVALHATAGNGWFSAVHAALAVVNVASLWTLAVTR